AISEEPVIAAPVTRAAGKTFKEQTTVAIDFAGGPKTKANVYYTVDGSQPNVQSKRYAAPISIDRSGTIKAVAVDSTGNTSSTATATYYRVPHNWTLKLASRYSTQYSGGGDSALIDGVRGTTNWSGGA